MRIAEWNQMMSHLTDPRPRTGFSNGGEALAITKKRPLIADVNFKEIISDSFEKISSQKGKVSISDVVKDTGYSKPTIYKYLSKSQTAKLLSQPTPVTDRITKEVTQIIDDVFNNKKPLINASPNKIFEKVYGKKFNIKTDNTGVIQKILKKNPNWPKIRNAVTNTSARVGSGNKLFENVKFKDFNKAFAEAMKSRSLTRASTVEEFMLRDLKRHIDQGGKNFVFAKGNSLEKGFKGLKIKDLDKGDILTFENIKKGIKNKDPRFIEYNKVFNDIKKLKLTPYKNPVTKETTTLMQGLQKATDVDAPLHIQHNKGIVASPLKNLSIATHKANIGAKMVGSVEDVATLGVRSTIPGGKKVYGPRLSFEDEVKRLTKFSDRKILQTEASGFVKSKTPTQTLEKARLVKGVKLNSSLAPGIEKVFKGAAGIADDWKKAKYLKVGLKALGIVAAPIIAYDMYDNYMKGVPILQTLERSLIGTNFIDAGKEYLSLDEDERLARRIVKQAKANESVGSRSSFMQVDMKTPPIESDMTLEEAKVKWQSAKDEYKKNKSAQEESIKAARNINISNIIDLARGKRFTEGAGDDFFRQTYDIGDIVKPQISYSKTGKNKLGNTPLTIDSEFLNMLVEMNLPISKKLNLLAEYKRNKSRHQINLQDQEIYVGEDANRSRKVGLSWNEGGEGLSGYGKYNVDTGEAEGGIKLLKRFEDGGRVDYKKGSPKKLDRRTFMKIAGGIATIPLVGKYFKWGKSPAIQEGIASAIETVKRGVEGVPIYFNKLMQVIKGKGVDITDTHKTMPRERVTSYKNLELYEDGGNYRIKKVKDDGPYMGKELELDAKKDLDKDTFYGYDEATVTPDAEGKMKSIDMFIDEADHLELEAISKELDFGDLSKK